MTYSGNAKKPHPFFFLFFFFPWFFVLPKTEGHSRTNPNLGRSDDGSTPLYTACLNGHTEVVKALLSSVAVDVNKRRTPDIAGKFPLYAACVNGHVEIVRLLLAHPDIDVDAKRLDSGATALVYACFNGHVDIVRALLVRGSTATSKTAAQTASFHRPCTCTSGMSTLHAAAWHGKVSSLELLVTFGADQTVLDDMGNSP